MVKFTCMKCEFPKHHSDMDLDERMCWDCIDKVEEDLLIIKNSVKELHD